MPIKPILQLGHPDLYITSVEIERHELNDLKTIIDDLHDTMMNYRARYGSGRAIAAPQIGVFKRLVYMHVDKPRVFINPLLYEGSGEMAELWDECMSFPELIVKVKRHKTIRIIYHDLGWHEHSELLENDMAELLQHEVDHLDGILAIKRAIDHKSFALKTQRDFVS